MLPDPRPYFADLTDPRRETQNKLHPLTDIVMLVFCAVLSGIEDRSAWKFLPKKKKAGGRQFLESPNGIPSHNALNNVIGRLQPGVFTEAFLRWMQAALPCLTGE